MAPTASVDAGEAETSSLVADTAQAGSSDSGEVPAAPGLAGRLLGGLVGLLTCRRRAAGAREGSSASTSSPEYEALRKCGRSLGDDEKAAFAKMAWWSTSQTKSGAKVFVLAPRGPDGDTECYIPMWKLLAYTASQMHEHVVKRGERFAVVWVQCSNHRVWPFTARAFKSHLHERYARCLDAVHVVHPSWTVRFLRLALWPFASDAFWDQFECHERVEFLDSFMDLKKLELPDDIYEFDKFLDRQAEETSKESARQMNGRMGFGGGLDAASDPQSMMYKEQMDAIQQKLQGQGRDKKSD